MNFNPWILWCFAHFHFFHAAQVKVTFGNDMLNEAVKQLNDMAHHRYPLDTFTSTIQKVLRLATAVQRGRLAIREETRKNVTDFFKIMEDATTSHFAQLIEDTKNPPQKELLENAQNLKNHCKAIQQLLQNIECKN